MGAIKVILASKKAQDLRLGSGPKDSSESSVDGLVNSQASAVFVDSKIGGFNVCTYFMIWKYCKITLHGLICMAVM